ncbi:MAG: hypothetical protein EON56_01235 [Alphaproteobacteria bacterium]|nr:MAG: hypothetical protein EON56_01235 [Alphaproteobacteria bacterium]
MNLVSQDRVATAISTDFQDLQAHMDVCAACHRGGTFGSPRFEMMREILIAHMVTGVMTAVLVGLGVGVVCRLLLAL